MLGHYAECRVIFIVMLSVNMLNIIMLSVVWLNVVMLSVVAPLVGSIQGTLSKGEGLVWLTSKLI